MIPMYPFILVLRMRIDRTIDRIDRTQLKFISSHQIDNNQTYIKSQRQHREMSSTCANEQQYINTAVKWKIGWLQQPVTTWLIYSCFFHVGQLSKSSPRSTAETRASNVFPSRRTRSCFSPSSSVGSRSAIRKTE